MAVPLRVPFSTDDLKNPEGVERVLRNFQKSIENVSQAPATAPTLSQATLDSLAAQIRNQLQAGGKFPLNLQSLLPADSSTASIIEDTHANRTVLYTPPSAVNAFYWETDRTVLYISILSGGSIVWRYAAGAYMSAIANLPVDLGANDSGFKFIGSDTVTEYEWSGSKFNTVGGIYQIIQNSTTAGNTDIFIIQHLLNNLAGANGMAASFLTQLVDSTKATVDGSRLGTVATDATAATFSTAWVIDLRNAGGALSEIVRVLGSGAVGINTIPAFPLDLNSGTHTYFNINAGAAFQTAIQFSAGGVGQMILYRPGSTNDLSVFSTAVGDIFRLQQATGWCGILSAAPSAALSVGPGNPFTVDASGNVVALTLVLTTPLAVLQGGTGSTTAAGARTNLGAAASGGVGAHTMPVAKLTIAGTNGSITWNADGCVTAFIDPT